MDEQEQLEGLIQHLNREAWPYLLFKRNAPALTSDEILAVQKAVAAGRERANQTRRAYPGQPSLAILRALQVEVEVLTENPLWGSRMQCAEYQQRPPKVTIYRVAMEKLAEFAGNNRLPEFQDPARMQEISLTHELYHHLERTHFTRVSREVQFIRKKLGPFTFYRQDQLLDEIAAQAFSQEFIGLTLNPAVLNLLLAHRTGADRASLLEAAESVALASPPV